MRLFAFAFATVLALGPAGVAHGQDKPLRVGVTAGPHAQITEVARKVAERDGLKIDIVEFTDFIQPNAALANRELDANIYQHVPFLQNQNNARGYKLVPVADGVVQQMGVYSRKVKSLADLPEGARVGIPSDPTNGARALLVLEERGLIKLKPGAGVAASVLDVVESPKKIRIVELEAAQLPRSLDDLDAAAVNTNYAIPAGLHPNKDAIALEKPNSPFAIVVIATRDDNRSSPGVAKLVRAYRSAEVKQFVTQTFNGAYTTSW